ncbi:MAG: hypothetical protein GXO04_03970 [Aquificae bacterium]|nr:hypothetical protein [Aquificota bacterium]
MMLPRPLIYALALLLFSFYAYVFFLRYNELRNYVNNQYLSFKDFVFELENTQAGQKVRLTEDFIRSVARRLGIELKEITYEEGKFRIRARGVEPDALVLLVHELEKGGRLLELKAVDNTGRGRFDVSITVRAF